MRTYETCKGGGQSRFTGAPRVVNEVLSHPGTPLPHGVRTGMEQGLGYDFAHVRVHHDREAAASAAAVEARAYTVGPHVVFGAGQYAPDSDAGRALLRHELLHTVHQGPDSPATGTLAIGTETGPQPGRVLQRQPQQDPPPAAASDQEIELILQAAFTAYERSEGKAPPTWLKDWARRYEIARRAAPTYPPVGLEQLKTAAYLKKWHNTDPPLPEPPMKLAPGAVGANEILPFPKGSRVLITQLLSADLARHRDLILSFAAEKSGSGNVGDLAKNAGLLIDLLTDPEVTKSLEAEITESTPLVVKAKLQVPAIPAKQDRPAMAARTIDLVLEAYRPDPVFYLRADWGTGATTFRDITARRGPDGMVVVSAPMTDGFDLDIGLGRGSGGVVTATVQNRLATVLAGHELKLVQMTPLSAPAGTAEAVKEKQAAGAAAKAATPFVPSGHQAVLAGGWQPGSAVFSAGWRFVYSVVGEGFGVPVQIQLDYAPKSGFGTAGVQSGAEVNVPAGPVPLTMGLQVGVKGGRAGLGTEEADRTVLGPVGGVHVGVQLGQRVRVFLDGEYFMNVVTAIASDEDVEHIPSVKLGTQLRF